MDQTKNTSESRIIDGSHPEQLNLQEGKCCVATHNHAESYNGSCYTITITSSAVVVGLHTSTSSGVGKGCS
jgi:hypothetical protein